MGWILSGQEVSLKLGPQLWGMVGIRTPEVFPIPLPGNCICIALFCSVPTALLQAYLLPWKLKAGIGGETGNFQTVNTYMFTKNKISACHCQESMLLEQGV